MINGKLLYKNIDNNYKLMLPNQIALDFFKQCHSNNLHILPKDLENYMQTFWYDKYNAKIARTKRSHSQPSCSIP